MWIARKPTVVLFSGQGERPLRGRADVWGSEGAEAHITHIHTHTHTHTYSSKHPHTLSTNIYMHTNNSWDLELNTGKVTHHTTA